MTVNYPPTTKNEILPSAARAALVAATDLLIPDGCEMFEVIDVQSAHSSSPSRTLTITDADGGTVLASSAITGEGTTVLRVGAYVVPAANAAAQRIPHAGMKVAVAVGNSNSATYSISCRFR